VAGEPNRRIAPRYGVTETALRRHAANHLPASLVQAQQAAEVVRADSLLAQALDLQARAQGILNKTEADGNYRAACSAIREARGLLELQARLLGELDERPQVNVLVLPEWQAIRGALVAALAPYPEARQAVAGVLAEVEHGRAGA